MRIPLHNVYRAFPEFDAFSDERCSAYMRYVQNRHTSQLWTVAVVAWIGAIIAALFLVPVSYGLIMRAARSITGLSRPNLVGAWGTVIAVASMASGMGSAALGALVVRDINLRNIMRKQIKGVTCTCGYSLLGAIITDGQVRCPECGVEFGIASRGLREQDFNVGAVELPGLEAPPLRRQPRELGLDPVEEHRLPEWMRTQRHGKEHPGVASRSNAEGS